MPVDKLPTEILILVTDTADIKPITVTSDIPDDMTDTWWSRYERSLSLLPSDTRSVIAADSSYIANHVLPYSNKTFDFQAYDSTRTRTGIVVGSVQSGKTASMLAVAALLLDKGLEILVILAGTRVGLWLQTYERVLSQLDNTTIDNAWLRNEKRILIPQPEDILHESDRINPTGYLSGARLRFRNALQLSRPIIFVIPKEDDHLLALSRFIESELSSFFSSSTEVPLRMVVLDDEADEASILESGKDSKITPKFIQNLWSGRNSAPSTQNINLYATYVAYTATPQANYLQQSHNPLAPRDFHAALRVPFDRGSIIPRQPSYIEKEGVTKYYCGGEMFYERLQGLRGDPCISYQFPQSKDINEDLDAYKLKKWEMLGDSLRSFFVSGALRLLIDKRSFSDDDVLFQHKSDLLESVPNAHSMLYHPSALKIDHFAGAEDIIRWCQGQENHDTANFTEERNFSFTINSDDLKTRLTNEEDLWRAHVADFLASAGTLSTFPGSTTFEVAKFSWEEIRQVLLMQVFKNVKIRVLNSDPRADDRPSFSPQYTEFRGWSLPRDIYTIFVAGNVLSRGLTVEGLCTSLFMRGAREPAADTQMQMQRWFGYRGKHLIFCRVFLFDDQLELFRNYHRNDLAVRTEILKHMDDDIPPFSDGVLVLAGSNFRATAKVESKKVPLHPGPTPAIRLFEPTYAKHYRHNLSVVQAELEKRSWTYLSYPSDHERGLICDESLSILQLAELLESFKYSNHDPSAELDLSRRWVNITSMLGIEQRIFNPPNIVPGDYSVDPNSCPYSIAAYLRLWEIALYRGDLAGMHPTDNSSLPWNMLDLASYRKTAPRFHIGIRFGSASLTKTLNYQGKHFPMMVRAISSNRDYLLDALWGSRNPGKKWRGDASFDLHYAGLHQGDESSDSSWRVRGQPGLILIHPVVDPITNLETISFGLVLPHGGPDHIAALRVKRENND